MNKNDKFNKFMQYKLLNSSSSSPSSSSSGLKGVLIFIAVIVGVTILYNVKKAKGSSTKSYTHSNTNYSWTTTYNKITKKATTYKSNSYKTKQTTARSSIQLAAFVRKIKLREPIVVHKLELSCKLSFNI